jgi:3-phenylpropionate/trans-cinnamate dioxygenase ferredoxin component
MTVTTHQQQSGESITAGWVRACALSDLPEDGVIRAEVSPRNPVAVVRTGGAVYAIRDVCSHADVPLSEGEVDGTTIECWLHGSRFDLRTGRPTGLPATKPVPIYQTKIDGDDVFVRIEEK